MGSVTAMSTQKRRTASEICCEKTTQSAELFIVSEFVGVAENENKMMYLLYREAVVPPTRNN